MTSPLTSIHTSCIDPSSSAAPECASEGPPDSVERHDEVVAPSTIPERALRFCSQADGVLEGYLCSERTVVSDACRRPKSDFDAFVCDEPRMHALQDRIVRGTVSVVRAIFHLLGW